MIKATDGEPPREFTIPENIRIKNLDPTTGAVADDWTSNPIRVALRTGQALTKPRQSSTIIEEDLSPESE
jgi:membrane carboxypeptidase/penicillin-binding protein